MCALEEAVIQPLSPYLHTTMPNLIQELRCMQQVQSHKIKSAC